MIRERFAPLMNDCHLMVASHLMPLTAQMFDNAPSALLDLAEQAESNVGQQRFFEAMRAIREHRPVIENRLFEELQDQFLPNGDSPPRPRPAAEGGGDEPEFALVDKETLEETLALQSMISRALVRYAYELYGLRQRLALVIGGRKLEEEEIPGGPHQLGACFREAAQALPLESPAKAAVYGLFERFVMTRLADLYKEYNSRLIQAGLLPHLKYDIATEAGAITPQGTAAREAQSQDAQGTAADRPPPVANAEPEIESIEGAQTFAAICRMLSGRRPTSGMALGPGAEPVAQATLISALSQLQRTESLPPAAALARPEELVPEVLVDTALIDQIKSTLTEQRERLLTRVDRERLASTDANVIDLVGLIFEYMLNEAGLPNSVKALLSRLHTPFLKVAILDEQFFVKESHPARQLLNAMIDAGARYVVETDLKRGIFPYLQSVVNRIREEFEDHLGLFGVLLVELQTRVEQMRNIAKVTEQRTREAASGQERLQQARERAAEVIDARIRGRTLPAEVVTLLKQPFADKLVFILLRDREGEQGPVWKAAVHLIEEIVWSTAPRSTPEAREDLRAQLPALQANLRAGLGLLARFGTDDAASLFEQLTACQRAVLDAAPARPAQAQPRAAPITARVVPATAAPSAEVQRIMHSLERVAFGTWFDFLPTEGRPGRSLKLAWYTPVADRYMFVDGMGGKASVLSRRELATEMAAGRVRPTVVEKRPFLDRALEAVRNLLTGGHKAALQG